MKWVLTITYLYITYNTFKYAKQVWSKESKKFASVVIGILGAAVPILGYIAFWK